MAQVAHRGLRVVPTILGVVTLVFLMLRLLPGDAAAFIAGEHANAETIAKLRVKLGLNEPLTQQYVHYIQKVVKLNFGNSVISNKPVIELVKRAMPVTVVIGLISLVLSFAIAVPLGTLAAYLSSRGKGTLDQGLTITTMGIDMIPGFWLALIFMLFFTLRLGWLPATGPMHWNEPLDLMRRMALPIMVLSIGQVATVARVTRTSVLEVLNEDYVRTARAMGTPEMIVLFRHALRNAALPVVTMAGLGFGRLLGGTVIIESIFAVPGMGSLLINGITGRDYPVVQGVVLMYASLFVFVNLMTDLAYARVDPRIKF